MKEKPLAGAVLAGRRFLARWPVAVVALLFLAAVSRPWPMYEAFKTTS